MRRRHLVVPAVVVAVAVSAAAAGAAWLSSGTGSSSSRSTNVEKPTAVAATATGTTSIQVTWSAPASGAAPVSYDVFRYSGATGTKVCGPVLAASPRVCNDTGLSPNTTYGYTVESRLGTNWMSGQTAQVDATTNAAPVGTPNFLVELATAGNKTAGAPFDVRVTARNGTTTDATYTGSHNLTFSGPGQNAGFVAPTYPASANFLAGVATVSVALRKAETATLTVAEGARTGNPSVTVVPGAANFLRYTSSSHDCSTGAVFLNANGGTWTSKVSRYDSFGNLAGGAAISVAVTKPAGPPPAGGSTPTSPLSIANGASESGTATSYKIADGQPPAVTITAASSGLTSATCAVDR
jgi:hypothetical protein